MNHIEEVGNTQEDDEIILPKINKPKDKNRILANFNKKIGG